MHLDKKKRSEKGSLHLGKLHYEEIFLLLYMVREQSAEFHSENMSVGK